MATNQKEDNAKAAATNAAADALFQKNKAEGERKFETDKAQTAKYIAEHDPAVIAHDAALRADQERSSMGIVGATLGIAGIVTGAALLNRLDGVTPIATLSGPQGAAQTQGVIQGISQQSGFSVSSPANSAANGPVQTVSPLNAFLNMTPNKGP